MPLLLLGYFAFSTSLYHAPRDLGFSESIEKLSSLINLKEIDLSGNCISSYEQILDTLKSLKAIISLKLAGNPVCLSQQYSSSSIFEQIPSLEYVDNM